jgi:uncharacterized protein YggE
MSRRAWIVLVVAVAGAIVISLAAAAFAQGDPSPNGKPAHTISVSSTATVKATPDEAVVDLTVRSESADSAAAFSRNATQMQAVLNALRVAGLDEKKDVQTTNVSLDQRVVNRGKANERQVFEASNSVEVTIHDLSSVGSVIDAAVRAGADSVNDIRFEVSNPNTVRTDALSRAVAGARAKADALAKAAGAQVVAVVSIDERNYQPPVYRTTFDQALVAAPAVTPIVPPDSLQVTETISAVWEIT